MALIDETAVGELLADRPMSVRLKRIIGRPELAGMSLRSLLQQRLMVEAWMLRQPNCGQRSVSELMTHLAGYVRAQLGRYGVPDDQLGEATARLLGIPADLEIGLPDDPPPDCSLFDLVDWLLARLEPRQLDIIRRRFGIGCADETLEEIGRSYNLTRERIRQLESRALSELRLHSRRSRLKALLDEYRPVTWDRLADGKAHLTAAQLNRRESRLDRRLHLALAIRGLGLERWIAGFASRIGAGRLHHRLNRDHVKRVAKELRLSSRGRPLPRTLDHARGSIAIEEAAAAAELVLRWHLEAGYAYPKKPATRLRRATALHWLLTRLGGPAEVRELLDRYHAAVPHDPCSDRDLVIVMEAARHLFVEIWEGRWQAVGPAGDIPPSASATVPPADSEQANENTITAALERELLRVGPTRLGELMARARDILPSGRSANSLAPTLIMNPARFIRVLPGVYALPSHKLGEEEILSAHRLDFLLNEKQARLFGLARRCGEPWGRFPLWSPAAEMRLCRWARANAAPSIFRSLLSVASPEEWPTDQSDRQMWLDLRRSHGRFELGYSRREDRVGRPPLERILAAGLQLRTEGSIGFMTVNRILGIRLDSSNAATVLAVLTGSAMAVAPDGGASWQRPHLPGRRLDQWLEALSEAHHSDGQLAWQSDVGAALGQALDARVTDGLSPEMDPVVPADFSDEDDEFERFIQDHRRAIAEQRREDALNWLDSE